MSKKQKSPRSFHEGQDLGLDALEDKEKGNRAVKTQLRQIAIGRIDSSDLDALDDLEFGDMR